MTNGEKPAGARLMERFRKQHVALRWGVMALIAMVAWILITSF